MSNKLINLANYLDESGFKKEADRVDMLIIASKDKMSWFEKYIKHTALNAGQAARVIAGPYDKSSKERLMELFKNFYYAAIPPWTHHTEEDLQSMSIHTVWEWFLCGYMENDEEYNEKCLEKEASIMNELIKNADWRDYIREPGEERECLTPGSQFHMHIGGDEVSVSVDLPMKLPDLTEDELQEMDDAMHDAMEAILAKYFEDEDLSPEDIHDAADAAGIVWDNNKGFMDRTEGLVGKRHLDDMKEEELRSVLVAIEGGTFW